MLDSLFRSRVNTDAARQLVEEGATLLDVRTPEEFAGGHVEGAINIPVQILQGRCFELAKDDTVVVYCRSGGRSATAAKILARAGFHSVVDVGPMPRW